MDIMEASKNEGVDEVDGFCDDRPESNLRADLAYDIDSRAMLSVSTYNVFPGLRVRPEPSIVRSLCCNVNVLAAGFPRHFSIIATVKPQRGTKGFLFSIYSGQTSRKTLAFEISSSPYLLYEDYNGAPGADGSPRFSVNMADGECVHVPLLTVVIGICECVHGVTLRFVQVASDRLERVRQ